MAAATSHISHRVLSMDATAVRSCPTVSLTTVDDESTTSPGGTCFGVPLVATAVISGFPPVTPLCTVARGMYTSGMPPVMVRPSTVPTTR